MGSQVRSGRVGSGQFDKEAGRVLGGNTTDEPRVWGEGNVLGVPYMLRYT